MSEERKPTHDEIARRAYEISLSGEGGSEAENWHRAERELEAAGAGAPEADACEAKPKRARARKPAAAEGARQ